MHYAIGDVHGCFDEMMMLIEKIERKDKDAVFLFTGDLVDRGPKVWETLTWAMEHITKDGKYQCVRGNHEEWVLEWYQDFSKWWYYEKKSDDMSTVPETYYDFILVAEANDVLDPEKLLPVMNFFAELPYWKKVEVKSAYGKDVDYRIVHAWYNYQLEENCELQKETNLMERNYWGIPKNKEIIIHGHTPTISARYLVRGTQDAPGMICYRPNTINVDGGCCFKGYDYRYPNMLCGICLETLEEIYPYTIEECLKAALEQREESWMKEIDTEMYCEMMAKQYRAKYLQKEPIDRIRLLEKIGKDCGDGKAAMQ